MLKVRADDFYDSDVHLLLLDSAPNGTSVPACATAVAVPHHPRTATSAMSSI